MEDSKLFKNIWRFNAIVIMLAGLLGVALAFFASIMIYKDITRDRSVRNIVNIEESENSDNKWQIGNLIDIKGSGYIMLPLYSEQKISRVSYAKSSSSSRNYLFINFDGNKKHWLFPQNEFLITQTEQLPYVPYGEPLKDTKAILYYVVKSDTNNDQSLTYSDLTTVSISKPNGKNYVELITDIDFVIGYKSIHEDSVILIYQKKNIAYSVTIDLLNFSISNEEALPSVQP